MYILTNLMITKKVANLIKNNNLSCCTLRLNWSPIDVLGLPERAQTPKGAGGYSS